MAQGLQRKRQRQQQSAELQQLRAIIDNAAPRQAFVQPPVPRSGHHWDWECGTCGHVNFAGRTLCHKHLCIGPRSKGHTMVGFQRGILQTNAAAQSARQQQLQALSLPSAYQVAGRPRVHSTRVDAHSNAGLSQQLQHQHKQKQQQPHQHSPTHRVQQPPRATTAVRQHDSGGHARSSLVLESGVGSVKQDKQPPAEQPRSFQQHIEDENVDEQEDEHPEEITDYESLDADPLSLRKRHVRLARLLERREKRLANERARIEAQHSEIAAQQAMLVELQSKADSTVQEIALLQEKVAATCEQLGRIEAAKNNSIADVAPVQSGPTPEQHAKDCLERTVSAFKHFQGQSPEVQSLLQQFVAILDTMRAAEAVVDARQTTLEQTFARAASSAPPPNATQQTAANSGVAEARGTPAPQAFDIGSEASTTEACAEGMRVDGHNVGDKRKLEHIHDAERISQEQAVATTQCEHPPSEAGSSSSGNLAPADGETAIEVDAQGANATPATLEPPPKTYAKRNQLLSELEDKVAKEAAQKRFSPYGQG